MTGKNVATVSKRSQYPIEPNPETAALVDALVGFKNSDGTYELRRPITQAERRKLEARRNALVDNLGGCRHDDVIDDVIEMLMGFDGANFQSEESAHAIASQYSAVLSSFPAWAVKRACGRWARGEVAPAEVGEKTLSRRAGPSTAQLSITVENIVRASRQELARLNQTLKAAALPKPATDAERAAAAPKIRSMVDEVRARQAESDLEDAARRAAADAEQTRRTQDWTRRKMIDEWRALGVKPPEPLFSVAMARSLGFEIMNGVLVRPREPGPKPDRDMNT